jgi:hypothetical protein
MAPITRAAAGMRGGLIGVGWIGWGWRDGEGECVERRGVQGEKRWEVRITFVVASLAFEGGGRTRWQVMASGGEGDDGSDF